MPSISVVLDIQDYVDKRQKPDFRKQPGYYVLDGPCQSCGTSLEKGLIFGKARLPKGDWFQSGKEFEPSGSFSYSSKPVRWLFENDYYWGREDVICACSKECAQACEEEFREAHKPKVTEKKVSNRACDLCGKTEAENRCAQCKQVWYCSRSCQRSAWKEHKLECKKAVAAESTQKAAAANSTPATPTNGNAAAEKTLVCGTCQLAKPVGIYSTAQLKKKGKRKCTVCIANISLTQD